MRESELFYVKLSKIKISLLKKFSTAVDKFCIDTRKA